MATARNRLITDWHAGGGSYTRGTTVSVNPPDIVGSHRCEDVVGNREGDNRLVVTHKKHSYFTLNGDNGQSGSARRAYLNCRTVNFQPFSPSFPALDFSSLATRVGAGTNPGRPNVNLPVFLWELRELPGLIRLAGRSILGKVASGYLSWNFGWRPLLSDLGKLLSMQDAVDKRLAELQKLRKKGVLRRTLQLGTDSLDGGSTNRTYDGTAGLYTSVKSHATRKVWGSCVWRMSSPDAVPASHAEQIALARRAVLGLTPGNITLALWEALPWTWMIDWFTDIGSWFKATNNSIAYAVNGSACIMVMTTGTQVITVTGVPSWIKPELTESLYVEKRRSVHAFSPFSTSMPILSNGQLATAAALATQRLDAYASMKRK